MLYVIFLSHVIMSNSRNFSVMINLSMWFHDHRRRARIFINDDIQTIRDLEKHIEKIFKIKKILLTSRDEFLPPSEDIRILQQNDVLLVMPDTCEQEGLPKTTFVVTSSTDTIKTKKRSALATYQDTEPPKKKKKHHFEDVEYIYPSKEPKKEKKLNINRSNTVKNRIDITMDPEQEVVKDKKIKKKVPSNSNDSTSDILQERQHSQNKSNFMNINKLLPVLQSHIECYNKKVFNRTNEMGAASVSSETSLTSSSAIQNNLQLELYKDIKKPYKCKGTLSSYKKKLSVPTITNKYLQEKKVNIVKIEYLSGKHLNMRETESMKSSDTVERENNGDSAYVNNPKIAYININQNLMNKHILSSNNNDLERYMNRNTMKLKNPLKFSIEKEKCFGNSSYENENFRNVDHILLTTNDNIIERGETSRISNKDLNNTITKKEINAVSNETFCYRQLNPIIHNVSLSRNLETKLDNYDSEGSKRLSNTTENINTFEKCILFDKKRNICESISYDVEANSAERVSEAMDSVKKKYETDISQPLLNQCLENNVSGGITSYPVNETLENLSEELQRNVILAEGYIEKMKIHNLSTETDTFKENFSLVCKNNSTNNVSVNEETRTLSDSSKNSEIVLVEDARTLDKPLDTNHRNTSTFSSKKYLSGIGQLLGELRNNKSLTTGESMDSDYSEFVTKQKRKRIRKRKKKNKEINGDTSLNDSSVLIISDFESKPVRSRACPTMHLKFKEDGEFLKVVDVTKKENQKSCTEISSIPNIIIDSDEEGSSLNFDVKEEFILVSPSLKNLLPKIGDIIAFKIIQISENYTPEVSSSYIIGKVMEFKTESKIVLYKILHGSELCEKNCMLCVGEGDKSGDNNIQEFYWTDMIDPRLLFP